MRQYSVKIAYKSMIGNQRFFCKNTIHSDFLYFEGIVTLTKYKFITVYGFLFKFILITKKFLFYFLKNDFVF